MSSDGWIILLDVPVELISDLDFESLSFLYGKVKTNVMNYLDIKLSLFSKHLLFFNKVKEFLSSHYSKHN